MDVVTLTLLGIGMILFFGFFAGFIFKKTQIPDVIFLIILGFAIGPFGLNYVNLEDFATVVPIFTTFTLLFLLFDGAFNINLSSLAREFSSSFVLTVFNFLISSALVASALWLLGFWVGGISVIVSILGGFILGGVSSSFTIPILNQIKVSSDLYSLLTLESALTDVFCIVFSLSIMEVIHLGEIGLRDMLTQFISFFAIAGLIGLIAGALWIILILKVFKEHNYIMTTAFLLILYFVTEYLGGNGAIASLFFGLILKNSKTLSSFVHGITLKSKHERELAIEGALGVSVTTPSEEYFYHQLSFLLKTFFFVYIGLLIDISDIKVLIIGGIISVVIMFSRMSSRLLTFHLPDSQRLMVDSIFARGLAAAAVAQIAIQAGVPNADFIGRVTYVVITGTILLSSIRVFFARRKILKETREAEEIKEKIEKERKRKKRDLKKKKTSKTTKSKKK